MKLKVVFMGTPEFSVPTLKTLIENAEVLAVYSQPDKPVGRGLKMQASPVKQLALAHGIPVFTPEKISTPEEIERLKSFAPDFSVVVAYGQILRPAVIDVPHYGTINIHSSLLPRWRGAAPIQWSILSGDAETGITTMMIAPKLDAGDILLQEKTPISSEDTAETVHDRLSEMGAKMILPTLMGLKEGTLSRKVQDESQVVYAHKLTKEMENIDWTQSSRDIDLAVRALNPWPGTRIETESGIKIKIRKGRPMFHTPGKAANPGELISFGGELLIQCGSGIYQILELQEEGKRAITGQDFLNGMQGRGLGLPLRLKGKA
jgi:methionyl-tRNA formyltransferase